MQGGVQQQKDHAAGKNPRCPLSFLSLDPPPDAGGLVSVTIPESASTSALGAFAYATQQRLS